MSRPTPAWDATPSPVRCYPALLRRASAFGGADRNSCLAAIFNDHLRKLRHGHAGVHGRAPDTLLSQNPIRAHGKPAGMATCAGSASCRMHRGERATGKWIPHPDTIYEITRCRCVKRAAGYIQPMRTCRSCPTPGDATAPTSAPSISTAPRPRSNG